MPVFSKQFYSDTVPENIELHSPLSVAIQAESPLGRKLIYTIVKGNELEEFAVDFNTGEYDTILLILYIIQRRRREPHISFFRSRLSIGFSAAESQRLNYFVFAFFSLSIR